jgi:site-specific DNA-methyltransferase (adenine-specific)
MNTQKITHYKTNTLDLRLMDCMELMKEYPDKHFDLAIVDPPYGIGMADRAPCGRLARYGSVKQADNGVPSAEYFAELRRVSKNQIVWGGNYFPLPPSRCFVIWDKQQPDGVTFADAELAWASFDESAKTFRLRPQNADTDRIHPTQKPVRLYKWLLTNYAKQGDKILDTHLGSMSHAIASHYSGVHLTGCELDPDYFAAGIARVKAETAQMDMFAGTPKEKTIETPTML